MVHIRPDSLTIGVTVTPSPTHLLQAHYLPWTKFLYPEPTRCQLWDGSWQVSIQQRQFHLFPAIFVWPPYLIMTVWHLVASCCQVLRCVTRWDCAMGLFPEKMLCSIRCWCWTTPAHCRDFSRHPCSLSRIADMRSQAAGDLNSWPASPALL